MGLVQFKLIRELLDKHHICYETLQHRPVYTSEQAAKVRGVELKTGVKALILKAEEGNLIMGLVAADRKIDLKKLSKIVGTGNLRLATPQEVLKKTGCEIGSVHPFGNIHQLPTYSDISVMKNEAVNFNAGLHSVSIQMNSKDLVNVIRPEIADFSMKS